MVLGFRKRGQDPEVPAARSVHSSEDAASSGHEKSGAFVDTAVAAQTLKGFSKMHQLDPNLPLEELDQVNEALRTGDAEKELAIEHALVEDNSPYPEVRAAVRNYDEDLPANTIRAWVIGLVLTTVGAGINCLFSMRNPSIAITTYVVQLVAYPLGLGWDLVMPNHEFHTFGLTWNLKPGPFNHKEHTIIVVMANAAYAGGSIYATDTLLAQIIWYGQNFKWGFQILFALTTQMLGYGLAGISRRFLVWPAAAIWPATLVNSSLMYALHDHSPSDPSLTNGWRIGRYKLFLYIMTGGFFWYWFPGWIFQALSFFVFPTWIAPNNVIVNQIFGGSSGLGLIPITFDWTIITGYLQSPLIPPWFAIANTMIGLFIFVFLSAVGIHYTGAWYSDYLPMQDSGSYDNTGSSYNVSRVLTPSLTFNETAYNEYSPIYLSTNFALCYGISFAAIAAVIVHTALYHGKEIWIKYKEARNQEDDVHMRLMKKYRDAPDWWYLAVFAVMIALSFVTICVWTTHFTWWAMIVCIIIPLVWTIPVGLIQAITNIQIGLNVITEFIVGYMTPGRPLAMMMFKTYGYITMAQALSFVSDLKLGHYMKVPPRTMFSAQVIATIWSSIVQIAVMNWAIGAIDNICATDQANNYTCPGGHVFYTASVIWGAIGPQRIFSTGSTYSALMWYFLIGAAMPVIFFFAAKKWPRSPARYLSAPVMLGGLGMMPPATCYIFGCWGLVGFVFQRYIRQRYTGWWMQYNYITSAALDTGLILCTILIFLTLDLTNTSPPQWWGNVDVFNTMDMQDTAVRKVLAAGQTFD